MVIFVRILEMSTDELIDIVANNEIIGQGSYGILYKLDEDTIFKFSYKDFIDAFELKNNRYNTRKIGDISKIIDMRKEIDLILGNKENPRIDNIRRMIMRQGEIKLTTLTQGFVRINDYCVGYLLHYHKDMVNLFDYYKDKNIDKSKREKILSKIKERLEELLENHIYLYDFTVRNILYNPINDNVEIVDFEDSLCYEEERDIKRENTMIEKYKEIVSWFNAEIKKAKR